MMTRDDPDQAVIQIQLWFLRDDPDRVMIQIQMKMTWRWRGHDDDLDDTEKNTCANKIVSREYLPS